MRPLLNTLYVTTDGSWVYKDGENLVVEVDKKPVARVPVHMLQGLVCIGRVSVSSPLMGFCGERGICISYLSSQGKFQARVEGPVSGNVLLRREQYRRTDDSGRCAAIACNMVSGKVFNQRAVLARALRDHGDGLTAEARSRIQHAVLRLKRLAAEVQGSDDLDVVRGMEGEAAQLYFSLLDHLIRVDDKDMRFGGRSRRPPRDRVNALLSLLYTLLTHDCRGALEAVGLDPAVGFLHRDRPGRPSLALDMMEEFRPVLADRLALSLINRRQISARDFQVMDNGAVLLKDDARKVVLTAWQERKRESIVHPYIGESAPIGLFPFLQSQLLARHLRGDLDGYPPFLWK